MRFSNIDMIMQIVEKDRLKILIRQIIVIEIRKLMNDLIKI